MTWSCAIFEYKQLNLRKPVQIFKPWKGIAKTNSTTNPSHLPSTQTPKRNPKVRSRLKLPFSNHLPFRLRIRYNIGQVRKFECLILPLVPSLPRTPLCKDYSICRQLSARNGRVSFVSQRGSLVFLKRSLCL